MSREQLTRALLLWLFSLQSSQQGYGSAIIIPNLMEEVNRAWEGEWLFQHLPTRKLKPEQGLEPRSIQPPTLMLYDLSKLLNSICISPIENRKTKKFENDLSLNVPGFKCLLKSTTTTGSHLPICKFLLCYINKESSFLNSRLKWDFLLHYYIELQGTMSLFPQVKSAGSWKLLSTFNLFQSKLPQEFPYLGKQIYETKG